MTDVVLDNSNTSVSNPYYIRVYTSKVEDILDHEITQFAYPISPKKWVEGGSITEPTRNIFDMKQFKNTYEINGKLRVDSNLDSSWNITPVDEVNIVKERLKSIAWTGGVIQMTLLDANTTNIKKGTITSIRFTEDSNDQEGFASSPEVLGIQFTFLEGVNMQA